MVRLAGVAIWKRAFASMFVIGIVLILAGLGIQSLWGGVGPTASSILRNGDRVEVFRVQSQPYDEAQPNAIAGFKTLSQGPDQGPEFAARLSNVLRRWNITPSSYKCVMRPGVGFRVWSGGKAVEIAICLECDEMNVSVVGQNSLEQWYLSFRSERADVLALVKEALPNDAQIQALPVEVPGGRRRG